jgi:chromosomal replication initiator protein
VSEIVGRNIVVDRVTRIDLPGRQWKAGRRGKTGRRGKAPRANTSNTDQQMPCFVAGSENRLLVAAVESILNTQSHDAQSPETPFNPLVLLGPTGCGKSHLANGIANHDWGFHQVAYLTTSEFCHLYQQAREQNKLAEWRSTMTCLRVFVLEDLHQMRIHREIQRELRLTIDNLLGSGAIVLITSQQPITMIHSLEKSLGDRLSGGLTVRIKPLDTVARFELLQLAADRCGSDIDLNSVQRLAQQVEGSAPKLFQALALYDQRKQLKQQAQKNTSAQKISITSKTPNPDNEPNHEPISLQKHVTMRQIITVLARYFSVTQQQLRGHSRRRSIVHARSVAVYLARMLTDLSYAQIGHHLGNRDHTTTMHAYRKLQQLLATDLLTQECIDDLKRILTAY